MHAKLLQKYVLVTICFSNLVPNNCKLGFESCPTIFFGAKTRTNFYIFITCESSFIYCMLFSHHLASCIWWCSKHFFFLLTCHHFAHVTASSIISHIIIMYIIACCFICHCAQGGVVNFSLSPYTPPLCTCHLIIIKLFVWRYVIFYCLLSLYI